MLKKSADSEKSSFETPDDFPNESDGEESTDLGEEGLPGYHPADPDIMLKISKEKEKKEIRRKLNQDAREIVSNSIHKGVKLIVHRPDYTPENQQEYFKLSKELMPVVSEIVRKTLPLLEYEITSEFSGSHYYGSKFQAGSLAYRDLKYFAKKRPPTEAPSLAVGLRIDESASMSAFGRLEAAKRAVLAVYEFCEACRIPILIYGDTADASKLEQMSVFAYAGIDRADSADRFRLMGISARSNNRDGMALRIIAEKLNTLTQHTRLLISISDGQPKAMDKYTGEYAVMDMQQTIAEYERKGVEFLAAAIGQDKDVICRIYGKERFLDITDLKEFPARLVRIIARYL